jgi:hypothetical protein
MPTDAKLKDRICEVEQLIVHVLIHGPESPRRRITPGGPQPCRLTH